jgi:hypothetical protein
MTFLRGLCLSLKLVPLHDQALETKKNGVNVLHRYTMGVNYLIPLPLLCLPQYR